MPELFLKADPTKTRNVTQEELAAVLATGQWEPTPGQTILLKREDGTEFGVDSSQIGNYLGPHAIAGLQSTPEETGSIAQRKKRAEDVEQYTEGFGNQVLGLGEAAARGLFFIPGLAEGASIRREELGWLGTGVEIGAAALPLLFSGGASGAGIAGRLLAKTPAGMIARGGEAVAAITARNVAGLAEMGVLGRAAKAVAPAVAQGVVEGTAYGAGEGFVQASLGDKEVTVQSIFSEMTGRALHGGLIGGGLLGAGAAAGVALSGLKKSIAGRLETGMSSAERRELAERIAQTANPEVREIKKQIELTTKRDELDLLEAQAKQRKVYEEVEGIRRMGEAGRERSLKDSFARERANLEKKAALNESVLAQVDDLERARIHDLYGYKKLSDNPELMAMGKKFAGELEDTYGTLGYANKMIQQASDLTGLTKPLKGWKETYARWKGAFTKGGKLITDPEDLVHLMANPENRAILAEVEEKAGRTFGELAGKEMQFDDMLANYKITDEFVKASKVGVDKASGAREELFKRNMGIIDEDKRLAKQEMKKQGEAEYWELELREKEAVTRMRADSDLAMALEREPLDALTAKIEAHRGKDLSKALVDELEKRTDLISAHADRAGLKLSMMDKLALANALGMDLDIVPEGSIIDQALTLHGISRLGGGRGAGGLVSAVLDRVLGRMGGRLASMAVDQFTRPASTRGARQSFGKRAGAAVMRDIARGIGGGATSILKGSEQKMERAIVFSVDKLLKGGRLMKPYAVMAPLKVLNSASFLGGNDKQYKNAQDAFAARSDELTRAANNPEAVKEIVAERLGVVAYQDPLLADKLTGLALRRIQFLYDKMPKDPGLGGLGLKSFWRPPDSEIAKWSRYVQGTDNLEASLQDLAAGRLSHEQAEAMATVLPDVHNAVVSEAFDKVSQTDKTTGAQRIQLSVLFRGPVDFSQVAGFMSAMQANFQEQPQPADESTDMSRLTPTAMGAVETPAQRQAGK